MPTREEQIQGMTRRHSEHSGSASYNLRLTQRLRNMASAELIDNLEIIEKFNEWFPEVNMYPWVKRMVKPLMRRAFIAGYKANAGVREHVESNTDERMSYCKKCGSEEIGTIL